MGTINKKNIILKGLKLKKQKLIRTEKRIKKLKGTKIVKIPTCRD